MAASQLHGGHGSPLPAYKLWPGSKINLMGGTVDVIEVVEDHTPGTDGAPYVSIRYRVDYANGTHLIGLSQVPALRSFDIIDDGSPF
jgi:hypothetical protein